MPGTVVLVLFTLEGSPRTLRGRVWIRVTLICRRAISYDELTFQDNHVSYKKSRSESESEWEPEAEITFGVRVGVRVGVGVGVGVRVAAAKK